MKPDHDALADLLERDSIAGIAQTADVAAVLRSRRQTARALVAGWIAENEEAPAYSPWAVLDHEVRDAYFQLEILINRPDSIDQGDFGHCGPASVLAILFTYFPNKMASFSRDLITTGSAQLGKRLFAAPAAMLEATVQDLEIAIASAGAERPLVPQSLSWLLMAALQYEMSRDEDDVTGLQNGGAGDAMTKTLLKDSELVKNLASDRPLPFDLDHPVLAGKSDNALLEVLLTCNGAFLEGSESRLPAKTNHIIWLRKYAHVAPNVEMTYYTWGQSERRTYNERTFAAHASDIISFTIKIDAAN